MLAGRPTSSLFSRHYKCWEVMHMSDYEILMLIFTVIGLFLAFYKQGKNDR